MASIIKFCALSGALDDSPHSYLLTVDDFTFLLDCGWDENCSDAFINELKKHVSKIDAVLITYPDVLHLGALPYAVGKLGLSCPIYCTVPIYKMGQMFMYDLYLSKHNVEEFDIFDLDDVDNTFDKVVQLKYNQSVPLQGKGLGLIITPFPAGHMLGGTVWKIVKDGKDEIIYAVDFNNKKERHLNGCELEQIQRPSLLITDAYNTLHQQTRRRLRDIKLETTIRQTLQRSGNVLVAVDTAGRMLELAQMLEQLWSNKESGLRAYSLVLLSNVAYNVVEFAKLQIEWMSDKLMKLFEGTRTNPFNFRYLKLCHTLSEVLHLPGSCVVLSSSPDLECGFARDLFSMWCSDSRNSIVLTNRSAANTLGRKLMDNPELESVTLELKKRVQLTEMVDCTAEPRRGWNEGTGEPAECPTKCISTTVKLTVNASIECIDFEGRSDGESLRKFVESMKPKQTIVVRGSQESCDRLRHICLSIGDSADIKAFIARKGETIDASIENHIYQVRLKDSLLSSLKFAKARNAEVAWIDARLTYQNGNQRKSDDDAANNPPPEEVVPLLETLQTNEIPGHSVSFMNQLKLSDFKQVLARNGISAEFINGALWCCNGTVALRRNQSGEVALEGCVSEDYYRVRELMYGQYIII